MNKWDERYLGLAREVSGWSKDPSRSIGAVVIGQQGQVLAQGYNGFPRGIKDGIDRLEDRDIKYKYVVHAEMNCIYNASHTGVSLNGATLYVYGLPVCSECAKGIIQVGIKRVVMPFQEAPRSPWKESWKLSKQLFDEVGIVYEFCDYQPN